MNMKPESYEGDGAPSGEGCPHRRGAVAVILRDGKFLVIRRSPHVIAARTYCFPGGGIEGDESEQEALVREIREELGAIVQPVRCVWRSVTPWKVELSWWLSLLEAGTELRPDPTEVESVHWFTAEEMARLPDLLESNHHFLGALHDGRIDLGAQDLTRLL
jgi:8-oxo-dGTP pyrophosphatase MutT (NUDIX family)